MLQPNKWIFNFKSLVSKREIGSYNSSTSFTFWLKSNLFKQPIRHDYELKKKICTWESQNVTDKLVTQKYLRLLKQRLHLNIVEENNAFNSISYVIKHLKKDELAYLPWRTWTLSLEELGQISSSITLTPLCNAFMIGTSLQSLLSWFPVR